MASQLNSGTNLNSTQGNVYQTIQPVRYWASKPSSPMQIAYFSRQSKGVFAPISYEEMKVTKKFWMIGYYGNKVDGVSYVIRDKHGDCKLFAQCEQNLPKGIAAILFLMGVHF